MGHVISDLSKYVITFFMIIYTLECFVAVATKKEHERGGVYIRQIICMFMVHFLGFAAICLETEDVSYIIFYGFQQILLFATIALFRVAYPEADKLVINNMCMLLTISFIMLTRISYQKSIRQFIIVAVSLIIGLFIPFLVSKLKFLKHLTWIYGMVGVFALLVVAVLGSVTHGSKISYSINGFTFQPSEFVKILFVFFIAGLLTESKSLGQVVISAVAAAAHVIILVFSKDLGSAVIFFAGYLIMVFIATKNYFYLFAGILGGAGASIVAYHMFSHVRTRVIAFLHPWSNINDSGYQITQSLFAIGICLILVCVSCFIVFMKIAMQLKEDFYRYIAVGISTIYIFQVFLTIGGGTRFIPLTGVTLPLVSYGGSSVLTTIIMFSIIQGLYCIQSQEGKRNARKERRRTADREAGEE